MSSMMVNTSASEPLGEPSLKADVYSIFFQRLNVGNSIQVGEDGSARVAHPKLLRHELSGDMNLVLKTFVLKDLLSDATTAFL